MTRDVMKFIAACDVCQRNKYETKSPAGLLPPLPIPTRVWEDISMAFISGLPRSNGVDSILVVVDRFSKYGHFVGLSHPFSAKTVADVFAKEIVRLHGVSATIVSDRDPIFLSSFWKELFKSMGTKLRMSSAYHPETDGQSEVLNRCVEMYLRYFASERPKGWSKWLAWAEFAYNTGFQSGAGTTHFEVVYGRPPLVLIPFMPGEIRTQLLVDSLKERAEILGNLKVHLQRALQRMVREANKHRRPLEFSVGDNIYLKFRPYRQRSLFAARNAKLMQHFFGPFEVLERIGKVAYRLKIPEGSRIHPVFHVSLLKPAIGGVVASPTLHDELLAVDPPFLPAVVKGHRQLDRDGVVVDQVLVQWHGCGEEESTCVDVADMRGQFPEFNLEDKAVSDGAVDRAPLIVYRRKKQENSFLWVLIGELFVIDCLYLNSISSDSCAAFSFFSFTWFCCLLLSLTQEKDDANSNGSSMKIPDLMAMYKASKDEKFEVKTVQDKLLPGVSGYLGKPIVYDLNVILKATMNLSERYRIGGSVYKAMINDQILSVKKTRDGTEEVQILQRVNHANLVKLMGVSSDNDGNFFIVYENIENGSLDIWLSPKVSSSSATVESLSWSHRVVIALDVANGLHHMHDHTQPSIVHKDIKTSNILLDSNFREKISNLSAARTSTSPIMLNIDVFSFGVVLLELLSGKKVMETKDNGEVVMLWKEVKGILDK
ncbi:hypothetical protein OROMI_012751 [Orobanche minor]